MAHRAEETQAEAWAVAATKEAMGLFLGLMGETEGGTWELTWDYALHPSVCLGATFTSTPLASPFLTDLSHSKVKTERFPIL